MHDSIQAICLIFNLPKTALAKPELPREIGFCLGNSGFAGVPEGFRFNPPKQETFFKDDANHDPIWSEEKVISANFNLNGVVIGKDEFDIMNATTVVVFEILEKVWATKDVALIDMKIEFGVDTNGEILVADIIDADSWRLWVSGDRRIMKDKQVFRMLETVTQKDLESVKSTFTWVDDHWNSLVLPPRPLVAVLMGSPSDEEHCKKIAKYATEMGLQVQLRVISAHKQTAETLRILAEYEGSGEKIVLIAAAGRSNGLGPVLSANSTFPVINCPPVKAEDAGKDIWSSLNVPSGLGCTTVIYPESAALAAAQIHALNDYFVWSRLRVKILTNFITLKQADLKIRKMTF
ncbi:multifunctional protein ADE2-like [Leptopilina heterotoma]|uniref:multifunctional protein ADE2-like n=1 Tax=Leptopilina heterotoma TaxID=63436 RepID=UPI001CA81B6C|nr:multifunctional protein ADE2-like [Leptopilina heterotoma]